MEADDVVAGLGGVGEGGRRSVRALNGDGGEEKKEKNGRAEGEGEVVGLHWPRGGGGGGKESWV